MFLKCTRAHEIQDFSGARPPFVGVELLHARQPFIQQTRTPIAPLNKATLGPVTMSNADEFTAGLMLIRGSDMDFVSTVNAHVLRYKLVGGKSDEFEIIGISETFDQ